MAKGYDPAECDGGEGHFWKKYARAHSTCWDLGGGFLLSDTDTRGRERLHLQRALQGWEQALHFLHNATDPTCWADCAMVSQKVRSRVYGKLTT